MVSDGPLFRVVVFVALLIAVNILKLSCRWRRTLDWLVFCFFFGAGASTSPSGPFFCFLALATAIFLRVFFAPADWASRFFSSSCLSAASRKASKEPCTGFDNFAVTTVSLYFLFLVTHTAPSTYLLAFLLFFFCICFAARLLRLRTLPLDAILLFGAPASVGSV
jgi:hypothetical protein